MLTVTIETNERTNHMYSVLSKAFREYRRDNGCKFTGLAYVSVIDLQCLADDMAAREAERYKRPLRKIKAHVGYQARILGVRVVGRDMRQGVVELE